MSLVAPRTSFQLGSQFMHYLCYHLIDLTLWRCYHQANICSSCPQGRLSPHATSFCYPQASVARSTYTSHFQSLASPQYLRPTVNWSLCWRGIIHWIVILKWQDRFYSVYCRRGKRPQYKPSSILLKQKVRSFSNAGVGSKKSPEECQGGRLGNVLRHWCLPTGAHGR